MILEGQLMRVELRYTLTGKAVANGAFVTDEDEPAVRVVFWEQMAEDITREFNGEPMHLTLSGRFKTRSWVNDLNQERNINEFHVQRMKRIS